MATTSRTAAGAPARSLTGWSHGGTAATLPTALALARRSWTNMRRNPVTIIPTVVMPLFFVLAFSGAFSALVLIPGHPTDNILSWMAPYAVVQGCAFAGVEASFALSRDLETGFFDRLRLSSASRLALLLGPLLYVLARSVIPITLVIADAFLGGADLPAGPVGLLPLLAATTGVTVLAALWGMGVSYRLRTERAGGLIQIGVFVALFLSIGLVPLDLQEGWLPHVARYNPITPILEMGRQGFIGDLSWADTWPGLVAIAGTWLLLGAFALRGFRQLDR